MVSLFLDDDTLVADTPKGLCCPECGEQLLPARLELAEGVTIDTVQCPNNCDLRPYMF